jgi:cyclopropane fatty-acyl-phospholipid synthase-like methyltransferase
MAVGNVETITMQFDDTLARERFPRSSTYDHDWMLANSMGPNALWITEFLSEALELKPGMKVLDLGCGKAMSSIFLAQEFDVEVWANDLWIAPDENEKRIVDAGLADRIHAVHAEAHALPYEKAFFDAIVSLDAYHYFGTDDLYLGYVTQYLKRGGDIGIVSPGLVREFEVDPPQHLWEGWYSDFVSFHSPEWWRRHWQRPGLVNVEVSDWLEDGWRYWVYWNGVCAEAPWANETETAMLEADEGRNLGFVRVVAELLETERWRS